MLFSNQEKYKHRMQDQAITAFLAEDSHKSSNVLVTIPVCNEEMTIADVVKGVRANCEFDLLIIDDGSTDSTASILKKLDVLVVTHPINLGAYVILTGLEIGFRMGYDYVLKIDGDNQHDPKDIARLYKRATETKADIVIGSRHLSKFNANIFSFEGSGMIFCSKLVSLLSGQHVTDTTSGFKVWSRKACDVMIKEFKKGKLREDSTYHVEELIIAARHKLKIGEVEVVMREREFGESKSYAKKKMWMFPINLIRATIRALI